MNCTACLLAAQTMSTADLLRFAGTGLTVVLTTLSILALFCVVMGVVFQSLNRASASPPVAAPVPTPASDELPAETVAVIAAAIQATLDGEHRIVHVGRAAEDAWVFERRMQHHTSHAVHRRKPQ